MTTPSPYAVPPAAYSLPRIPTATDNSSMLFIIIAPALLLPWFIYGVIEWLDDILWFSATGRQKAKQVFMYWLALLFFMLAVGYKNVHTMREAMVADYNNAVSLWRQSGEEAFGSYSSFELQQVQNYPTKKVVKSQTLAQMAAPVVVHRNGDDVAANVHSIYYEFNFSISDYSKYNQIKMNFGGTDNYRTSSISPYTVNQTKMMYVSCGAEYCTSGCDKKTRSRTGVCSLALNSPIRRMCTQYGGTWVPYSRLPSPSSCSMYKTCGSCTYQMYLDSVCYWTSRVTSQSSYSKYSSITPPPLGQPQLDSTVSGCAFPFSGQTFRTATNGYKPKNYVSVQVHSVVDPAYRLSRLTAGSNTFPISSAEKYGSKGNAFIAVCVIVSILAITLTCKIEQYLCFARLAGTTRMAAFMAQRNNVPNTDQQQAATATQAAAPSGENTRLIQNPDGGVTDAVAASPVTQQQQEEISRSIACQICLDAPRDQRFRPCGHHVTCEPCGKLFVGKNCPLCRQKVRAMEFCAPNLPTFPVFTPSS